MQQCNKNIETALKTVNQCLILQRLQLSDFTRDNKNSVFNASLHFWSIKHILFLRLKRIVLTGHVLRIVDLSNMTHHRPLGRGNTTR